MWGPSGPIRFAFRPGTMKVSAAVLLCVLGWPLCGSQDSEDMSWNSTWEKTGGNHPIGVASRPGKVSAVLTLLRDTAIGSSGSAQIPGKLSSGVKILAPKSPNATLQKAGASRILVYATSNAALQMPSASQGRTGRRGLQSSALRTLRIFAELVLPQTLAILPRVFTEMVAQKGDEREEQEFASWFEAYVCLLHKAQRRLDDERMWHAELEQKENATMQSDMRQCRSDLARIQQRRATAAQDAAAILHNLRLWQRIRSSSAESTSDSEERARADGHIHRLKAEQLRHSLDTRGLESQEKVARIRCGRMAWRDVHKWDGLSTRKSKMLGQAVEQIDKLGLDAPALFNISRSITLNVTLPACSSVEESSGSSLKSWVAFAIHGSHSRERESDQAEAASQTLDSAWGILSVLQRSLQQASHDIYLDLTELTQVCEEARKNTRRHSDALLDEDSDLLKIRGDYMHLERTVATMQSELVALQTAQLEVQQQAMRLHVSLQAADLPAEQRELCTVALVRLHQQQAAASSKVTSKKDEMANPQRELKRLRQVLERYEGNERTERREMTRDFSRENRCESSMRSLRTSSAIIARHSLVLTQLVDQHSAGLKESEE